MDIKYDFKNICPVCREPLHLENTQTAHIFLCEKESCREDVFMKVSPIVLYYALEWRGKEVIPSLDMMEINLSKYKVFFTATPLSLNIAIYNSQNYILDLSKPLLTRWGKQEDNGYRSMKLDLEDAVHFNPDASAEDLMGVIQTLLTFK